MLKKSLGPVMLWALGVGYVISGMYFGWNLSIFGAVTMYAVSRVAPAVALVLSLVALAAMIVYNPAVAAVFEGFSPSASFGSSSSSSAGL